MLVLGLGLDYGLGFSSDIRLRQDPQLRVSHLATTMRYWRENGTKTNMVLDEHVRKIVIIVLLLLNTLANALVYLEGRNCLK